ncbi:MAG: hypothetical protein R2800_02615 [Flavipsychrobacter sp.]
MSKENAMNYQDLDSHINNLDLSDFEPGAKHHFDAEAVSLDPSSVLKKICKLYRGIRPILVAITKIPLIPGKFTKPLKTFIKLMDTLCPGS